MSYYLTPKQERVLEYFEQAIKYRGMEWMIALINTGIEYGQDFFKQVHRSLSDASSLACAKIDGFNLFNHNKSGYIRIIHNGNMEWKLSIGVG